MTYKLGKTLSILAASYELHPFTLSARRGLSELEAMYALERAVRSGYANKTANGGYMPTFKLLYQAGKLQGVPEDSPTT